MDGGFVEFATVRTPSLFRAAYLLCGRREDAEDLVQDTLARVFARWAAVERAQNPAAYAQRMLFRLFIDGKRRSRSRELPTQVVPVVVGHDPDVALRRSLVAALGRLSRLDRAVLVLRYLDDLDVAAVAAELELTDQAVRSRSSRALARVRQALGPDFLVTT